MKIFATTASQLWVLLLAMHWLTVSLERFYILSLRKRKYPSQSFRHARLVAFSFGGIIMFILAVFELAASMLFGLLFNAQTSGEVLTIMVRFAFGAEILLCAMYANAYWPVHDEKAGSAPA